MSRLLIVATMFLMLCGASFAGSTPVDLPEKLKCQLHSEGFCYDNDECNDIDIRHISGHSETREIRINFKKENVVINNYGYGEIRHMTNIDFRNRGDLVSSWDLRDPEGSIWRDYLLRVPTGFRLETHFLANITPGKRDPTPIDGNFVIYDCFLRSETKAHRAQK